MAGIALLDESVINKIAAGEVVERPSAVVKELVENAIDAGANAVTVEIKDGGFSLIRITDNGCGIGESDIRSAFLRHATSKITKIEDLQTIGSLGFRGEALASIAAVSQTELVTKTKGALMGNRYVIEGGKEQAMETVGCPEGTTFLVRNLFYNTPARKKFMKTPQTEAGYTGDMIQYLAMSHPSISFKFINNGQIKIQTSGNGNRKEVIYSIFGRDIAANLCEVDKRQEVVEGVLHLTGFCGKPVISRGNRNLEMYFINGRYIKNAVINQAIEAAYKPYMMTRKYPFTALYLEMPQELVDVNVHPSKMEAQFGNREMIYQMVEGAVSDALRYRELIPEVPAGREVGKNSRGKGSAQGSTQGKERGAEPVGSKESDFGKAVSGDGRSGLEKTVDSGRNIVNGNGFGNERSGQMIKDSSIVRRERPAEPFEKNRLGEERLMARKQLEVLEETLHPEKSWGNAEILGKSSVMGNAQILGNVSILENSRKQENYGQEVQGNSFVKEVSEYKYSKENNNAENIVGSATEAAPEPRQTELFDMPLLSAEAKKQHRIIGQVFSTYWLVEFADKLFIIDQHAAHEKVLYERNVKAFHEKKEVYSQMIAPPAVVSLSQTEQEILKEHLPLLEQLGFEIEPFGGNEYALRAAPADMMNLADEEMFLEVLDALMKGQKTPEFVLEKLATISCKAAVKGGNKLKQQEIEELIDELLTLENPYHCPHGRPTIISMSRYEMEKKFKRIV